MTDTNDNQSRSPAEVIADRLAAGEITYEVALILMLGEIATAIWLMQMTLDEVVDMAKMDAKSGGKVH